MTTEAIRGELLSVLAELGQAQPNWRLGQTLANLAMAAGRLEAGGVWDLEDEEAIAAARKLLGFQVGSSVSPREHQAAGREPAFQVFSVNPVSPISDSAPSMNSSVPVT